MDRELVLPPDFSDYAWEVESKGVFWGAAVQIDGAMIPVTFYDPVRLARDAQEELQQRPSLALRRILVVSSLTEDNMRRAVLGVSADFFV